MEKLHDKELHGLYLLPRISRMIRPRMRWVMHVVHVGERRMLTGFWWGNLNMRDHLDGRILLKLFIQGHGLD
jgi:hypothetical protein